ncbi:MAG: hypothetical protein ACYC56_12450 [Candidatus Aquicultor sp.]
MKKIYYPLLIVILVIAMSGCKKSDNNPVTPPPTVPPDFNISAQPVTLATGDAGLTFSAHCTTDDVNLIKVVVQNPIGNSQTFNANNNLFLKDEEFQCQNAGTGYVKYLGTWSLTFAGNKASGSKASFTVTKTLSVTGKISAN